MPQVINHGQNRDEWIFSTAVHVVRCKHKYKTMTNHSVVNINEKMYAITTRRAVTSMQHSNKSHLCEGINPHANK
jgi:hypothetical protein